MEAPELLRFQRVLLPLRELFKVRLHRQHSSAAELSLLSTSTTTVALNSAINVLRFRFAIGNSFQVGECYSASLV